MIDARVLIRSGEQRFTGRLMRQASAESYRRCVRILSPDSIATAKLPPARVDLLVAAVVAAALLASTWAGDREPATQVAGTALSVAATAALWARRRYPILAGVAVSGIVGLFELVVRETGGVLIAPLLIAFYSIGAYAALGRALVGFGVAYAGTVLGLFADPNVRGNIPENAFFVLLVAGAAWISGTAVRTSRTRSAKLAHLAAQLERDRDEKARLAVTAERGRIARELHDVVAHGISVIAVQAGAGRHAIGGDARRAHAAFAAIEDTARQALGEMRRMLGLLRDRGEVATSAPLPSLADYEKLVERAKADGLTVDAEVEGDALPLPAGVDLAAYRILQEAITNVRKHAPTTRAVVRIRYHPEVLEIEVVNDEVGGQTSPAVTSGGGHGLIGMRERVTLYGGTLEAGPAADGGFRVSVRMPLNEGRL